MATNISKKKIASKAKKTDAKKVGAKKKRVKVQSRNRLLSDFTEDALKSYFRNLNGHKPANIYKLVLGEVEPPLLASVMEYSNGNQTLASDILGINRATLRKKLKQYRISS
ncbi:MAG: DNA-binding transcriptional regulator Fis [Gammaproteobacteria bacterium]